MSFSINDITPDQLKGMQTYGVWRDGCPVPVSRLRSLELEFLGFDGELHSGTIIVLDDVANAVIQIFKELLERKFPLERVQPAEEFGGDDVAMMEANNSSGFNGRMIMNTDRWSSHAYGVAIDINPGMNPYMLPDKETSTVKVYPPQAIDYVNRGVKKPGMTEEIVDIFAAHGFTEWGGNWPDRPDYHHFQLPWDKIREMFG